MPEIELSAGTIEYVDTGGDGPTVMLLHGLLMDTSLWDGVVADLSPRHRCIVPLLPLGAHRQAVATTSDLSLPGIARVVVELIERLDLRDVTLVGNDTGGAVVQMVLDVDTSRLAAIVLASCDAFDNFPPGATGKTLFLTGRLPAPLFGLFMQQMRLKPVRRLPIAFGWLTKRGDATTKTWLRPIWRQREIRRDAVRLLRAARHDKNALAATETSLRAFDRPALVVWASEDRVMPREHGVRLAELLPHGSLVEIADSYTLLPLDQPTELAAAIATFVGERDRQPTI